MGRLSRAEIFGITVFFILLIIWIGNATRGYIDRSSDLSISGTSSPHETQNEPESILVHIEGAVENPGLIELQSGYRVDDAINHAGGLKEDADTSLLNLADILLDGQKIYVPFKGEKVNIPLISDDENLKSIRSKHSGVKFPLNLNTASKEEFETLPGIGDVRAMEIIDYRNRHGGFKKKSEIMNVTGIGEKTYEKIKNLIYV